MKTSKVLAVLLTLVMLLSTALFTVSADVESAKEELAEAINEAESRIPPPGSNATGFGDLLDAIGEAELLLNNPDATELEIEAMIDKLENAGSGIIIRDFDNSKLWDAMVFANAIPKENYTEESYEHMKALANNYLTLHYASSQQEIDDLTLDIYKAVKALQPINGASVPTLPYTEPLYSSVQLLESLLEAADRELNTVGGNFNMETFYALMSAYEEGECVLADPESGNLDILVAADCIQEALDGLECFSWDTDALWEVIQQCEGIDEEDYEETSYDNYAEANHEAHLALYYAQSQEEVDNARVNLLKAIERLIKKDVKTHLEEELKKVEETYFVDDSIYTVDSLTRVGITYTMASDLIKENAPEQTLVQALNDLWDAVEGLEVAPSTTVTEPAEVTEATENTEATSGSEALTTTSTDPTEETSAFTNTTAVEETTEEPVIVIPTTTTADEATPTETKVQFTTVPHTYTYFYIGDADGNDKINIKDATVIQKHLAKILTLEGTALLAADGNGDLKVNIKDATEIQKFLANIPVGSPIGQICEASSTTTPSQETTAESTDGYSPEGSAPATEDELPTYTTEATKDEEISTVATEATEATIVTDATEATKTTEASEAATDAEEATTQEAIITTQATENTTETTTEDKSHDNARPSFYVYFTNFYHWDEVNIYYWNNNDAPLQWPGVPMEYVRTNIYGHDIYRYDLHEAKDGIIFNSGAGEDKEQTVDILGITERNTCFLPESLDINENWFVTYFPYSENSPCTGATYIDFDVVRDVRLYSGYEGSFSDETRMYIVRNSSDDEYKAGIDEDELPELDTDTLAQRNKALIIHLSFVGSGDASQSILQMDVWSDTLTVLREINVPKNGTPDMHYRLTAIEVDLKDVENVTKFSDSTIYNYNIPPIVVG